MTLFAVQRCRDAKRQSGNNVVSDRYGDRAEVYGPGHASSDTDITLCGVEITGDWWLIPDNDSEFDASAVTCPRCKKAMLEYD